MELERVLERIEELSRGTEFRTFLIGLTGADVDEETKKELKRKLGEMVERRLGKAADFSDPEVVFTVDMSGEVSMWIRPLYIYGRYRKLVRGIPQTRWPCRKCKGKGCERCGWKGKMYDESVEEIIAGPILRASGGVGSRMHALGREDIDARMLGRGRPFVIEILSPKRRDVDLRRMEEEINSSGKVEVEGLRFTDKRKARELKAAKARKTYSALVEVEGEVSDEDLRRLKELEGKTVVQRTPKRVEHRRAVKTRRRRIWRIEGEKVDKHALRIKVEADPGMYIKELISGDEGRTRPSVSEVLGKKARCVELDVIDVEYEDDGHEPADG